MKRRSFLAGLFTAPFVAGTLPGDLIVPVVEETVPLSKFHGTMVTGVGGGGGPSDYPFE